MTNERATAPRKPRGTRGGGREPRFYEALGRAIKTARTERGLERKDLAAATSLSYAYLSDIESGRRRPSSSAILEIADALGMSPSELMLWTEQLTHRIASEELAEETASGSARAEPPAVAGFAAGPIASPAKRRSWFEGSLANLEPRVSTQSSRPMRVQTDLDTGDTRASVRNALDQELENLGPEDLELVLGVARRLAREHPPPR